MTIYINTYEESCKYGPAIKEDMRVMHNIQIRVKILQEEMDRLEERWENRLLKLESRKVQGSTEKISIDYRWSDILA